MTDEEHAKALVEIERLARGDPPPGTPDGDRLLALAEEVDAFEKVRFPLDCPRCFGTGSYLGEHEGYITRVRCRHEKK